ncbi:hypothetical protein [Peribacillus phoenicis]
MKRSKGNKHLSGQTDLLVVLSSFNQLFIDPASKMEHESSP